MLVIVANFMLFYRQEVQNGSQWIVIGLSITNKNGWTNVKHGYNGEIMSDNGIQSYSCDTTNELWGVEGQVTWWYTALVI